MKSHADKDFWKLYRGLPKNMRRLARKAFRLFLNDPSHPSLHFKPLQGFPDFWSARVSASYRAVCLREGSSVYWFWIGSHADFDRDFA